MPDQAEAAATGLLGSGPWRYRVDHDWAKLPDGWGIGDVADVTVDDNDNVYVFTRGTGHPVMVFDRDGGFLRSWGEDLFANPHGITFSPDGCVYCTDRGDSTVRKFSPDGKLLLEIGTPGQPATRLSGAPFNECTHTALARNGDIFVTDGYGNARIHRFSPEGRLLHSWGDFGSGPGEFNLVHNISTDLDGWLYVADRENHRVQVFSEDGVFETEWKGLHRPCALCNQSKSRPFSFIGELGPGLAVNRDYPNLGPRISILDHRGVLVGRLGDGTVGVEPGQLTAPHGIALNSQGDLFLAELGSLGWRQRYPDSPTPQRFPNLKKLVRVV